jgi:Tfp pilus assembly protein PilV
MRETTRYRRRFRAYLTGTRRRLHAQRGFALIEVVVSAALLMVVAGGVLAGIEGPSRISGKNDARSQASTLAQQDQERMRALPFNSLVGYTQTTPVTVGGITYSRYSKAIWIRDNNDTDSCTTTPPATTSSSLPKSRRPEASGRSRSTACWQRHRAVRAPRARWRCSSRTSSTPPWSASRFRSRVPTT